MNRQRDLDIIAPDDPVINSVPENTSNFSSKKKKIKIKKIKHKESSYENKSCYRPNERVNQIISKTKSHFSTFVPTPKDFNFEEKDDCEEIIIVLRPHWFTNIKWILLSILFLIIPSLVSYLNVVIFGDRLFLGLFDENSIVPESYKSIGMFFWYLFIFIFGFENFLSWYFDVYIITDKRVVDIHFNNLLDKKYSEANIESIQDVTSRISGLSQTIFNYGDILVQTAGAISEINFYKIPHPNIVTEVIQELRQDIKDRNNKEENNER